MGAVAAALGLAVQQLDRVEGQRLIVFDQAVQLLLYVRGARSVSGAIALEAADAAVAVPDRGPLGGGVDLGYGRCDAATAKPSQGHRRFDLQWRVCTVLVRHLRRMYKYK